MSGTSYWGRLLEPDAFAVGEPEGGVRIDASRAWDELELAGERFPHFGYATYRLTVRLPPDTGVMAIAVGYIASAYRLWVNGEIGRVATEREGETPRFIPQIVHFAPEGETLEILLHVSNFALRRGGLVESLSLGTAEQILGQRERSFGVSMLVLGCISIMGLYHLGLP